MRIALGIAAAAIALLGACGGSEAGQTSQDPVSSATPKLDELADACVSVNDAAESTLEGVQGIASPDRLDLFANSVEGIAEGVDDRGRDAVLDLAQRAREVSETLRTETDATKRLEAGTEMLDGYKRLQDSCQAVGSPLSLPSSD
jgi:hypothetical protein